MKSLQVVAAVIIHNSKILCTQRGQNKYDYISFKWEFPGGKIENGESEQQALAREIKEELHLDIFDLNKLISIDHKYPDFEITMHAYVAKSVNMDLYLDEHFDFKWLSIDELYKLDWAAADIPIVHFIQSSSDIIQQPS